MILTGELPLMISSIEQLESLMMISQRVGK